MDEMEVNIHDCSDCLDYYSDYLLLSSLKLNPTCKISSPNINNTKMQRKSDSHDIMLMALSYVRTTIIVLRKKPSTRRKFPLTRSTKRKYKPKKRHGKKQMH